MSYEGAQKIFQKYDISLNDKLRATLVTNYVMKNPNTQQS